MLQGVYCCCLFGTLPSSHIVTVVVVSIMWRPPCGGMWGVCMPAVSYVVVLFLVCLLCVCVFGSLCGVMAMLIGVTAPLVSTLINSTHCM